MHCCRRLRPSCSATSESRRPPSASGMRRWEGSLSCFSTRAPPPCLLHPAHTFTSAHTGGSQVSRKYAQHRPPTDAVEPSPPPPRPPPPPPPPPPLTAAVPEQGVSLREQKAALSALPPQAYEPVVSSRGEQLRLLGGPLLGHEKYLGGMLGEDGKASDACIRLVAHTCTPPPVHTHTPPPPHTHHFIINSTPPHYTSRRRRVRHDSQPGRSPLT